eukprot:CAMPEP_0202879732 /NCGR_PEP_ID=MMETSP1391-20130828/34037_1 /ASSEMBLY_ACC=CAM_ASM_000867 /TAXON_ID=1034604 /ORGANISM="Chlamydomonas leiostraca, Strain SAG 11-49" /LENGTH=42 /DNA_ID= /DNA_START= /DNA_END= /DNA_ORIENTATION=
MAGSGRMQRTVAAECDVRGRHAALSAQAGLACSWWPWQQRGA